MTRVNVEHAQISDWRRSRAVRLRALADMPDAFGSTLDRETQFTDEEWRRRLASADAATFIANIDGADIGIVVAARSDDGEAGLYAMWVAPEARGKGAGDALITSAANWARERGFRRITLGVGDFNTPAIRLYERHGFRPTGETGTLPPPRTHVTEHKRTLVLRPAS
ncbi:MAG: GNAT family N-acetyltransferase [Hyphomonadaceae bacterium]